MFPGKSWMTDDIFKQLLARHHLVCANSIVVLQILGVLRQGNTKDKKVNIFKHLQPLAVFPYAARMHSY